MKKVKDFFSRLKVGFNSGMQSLDSSGKALGLTFLAALVIMVAVCVAVFFVTVKGAEEVLVPNVVGKSLEEGILEMQVKELFPKIQLRYSNKVGDEGIILEQNPPGGTITKASRYIELVVSRGVVIGQVENYVGMQLDELRMNLQTLFSGSTKPLIILDEPMYKADSSAAGTILEQDPPAGTKISDPITLSLVVSRGPTFEKTRVPMLVGMSVNDVLTQMSRSKIAFDFTAESSPEVADSTETTGIVVSQQQTDEFVTNYSKVSASFIFPSLPVNGNTYGIFATNLPSYPYALSIRVEAFSDGEHYNLVQFSHPGGRVTIPYAVPVGTTLVLYVEDKETARITVQ